jgi:hypothetical protein
MKIRRILAGTLVALLLCVSSVAAACDLSCGFALFRSDCHSPQMAGGEFDSPDMTMAGMVMPEMAGDRSAIQQVVFTAPQAIPVHPVLGDMGVCARQSCDQDEALASKANHSTSVQFETISIVAGFSRMESLRIAFREARDDIAPTSPIAHSCHDTSLRI